MNKKKISKNRGLGMLGLQEQSLLNEIESVNSSIISMLTI